MHSKGAEGKRLAGLCVHQQHLTVQDEVASPWESLGDEVLEVLHLADRGRYRLKAFYQTPSKIAACII